MLNNMQLKRGGDKPDMDMTEKAPKDTLWSGVKAGVAVTLEMAKVIVPIYIVVGILDSLGFIGFLSKIFSPLMQFVGLSGEAALVLSLGYLLNHYAAIGMMLSLSLPIRDMTILAMMMTIAHSLPLEIAVNRKTGVKVGALLSLRITLSFLGGMILNIVL